MIGRISTGWMWNVLPAVCHEADICVKACNGSDGRDATVDAQDRRLRIGCGGFFHSSRALCRCSGKAAEIAQSVRRICSLLSERFRFGTPRATTSGKRTTAFHPRGEGRDREEEWLLWGNIGRCGGLS